MDQRRLARAIRADQCVPCTDRQRERYVSRHLQAAKILGDAHDRERGGVLGSSRRRPMRRTASLMRPTTPWGAKRTARMSKRPIANSQLNGSIAAARSDRTTKIVAPTI